MKIGTLLFAAICVIIAIGGVFLVPVYFSSFVTSDIEVAVKLLWSGLWAATFFAGYFWTAKRHLRQEWLANQVTANTSQIATDVIKDIEEMEQTLIRMFCIAYTPNAQSTPDTRYYPVWRAGLFKANGGQQMVLQKLKKGMWPTLPQMGTNNPPRPTPLQREAFNQLFQERRSAHITVR